MITFIFAIIVIYLVLAAQYESLRDPFIILVSVPMSICGALIPLAMGMATINIYTQIGLVTLIGLISKHGILMVEFANEMQISHNLDRRGAMEQAARIRLRPILMTTAAMVVGLIPLLFATGAGAHSRYSLGLVIVVGMLVGTLFTLFVLPTVYTVFARDHRAAGDTPRARAERWRARKMARPPEENDMKHSILYPRLRATAAALALALVAAGCAVGPDYQKPQSAPVTLASPEQALFSNGQLQRDWWKQLQDPQLDRLIGLALERNHDIRIAQARLAESRAVLDEKELDQLPTVTAGGRYERSLSQTNPGPEGERNLARSYRAGFDASWEIDLFGRLRRAAEARAQPGAGRRSGAGPHRGRRRGGAQLFRAAWRRAAAGGGARQPAHPTACA